MGFNRSIELWGFHTSFMDHLWAYYFEIHCWIIILPYFLLVILEVSAIFRQVPGTKRLNIQGPEDQTHATCAAVCNDHGSTLSDPRRTGGWLLLIWRRCSFLGIWGMWMWRNYEKMGYTSAENGQSWEGKWWVDLGALNFNIWRQNHMRIDTSSRKSCPFPLSATKETNSVSDDTRSKAAHEKARRAIVRPTATVALAGAYGRSVSQHMTPYVQPLHRWTRCAVKWIMA